MAPEAITAFKATTTDDRSPIVDWSPTAVATQAAAATPPPPEEPGHLRGVLADRGARVPVDFAAAAGPAAALRGGALVQVLGELRRPPQGDLLLRARIVRPADGLDMGLYERCLQVRREFEAYYCPAGLPATRTG
ncbi:unnamed protein product [Prorocentrum cordatum]|uniref:DNA helicase n=1 Tax=Prorocentrum cordatum TaxID=2364126 RepID=A0ABN9UDD8_9DINO|nr:unnamed protein product [Polarella glacialis]